MVRGGGECKGVVDCGVGCKGVRGGGGWWWWWVYRVLYECRSPISKI